MLPNNLDCWFLTQRWVKLLPNIFAVGDECFTRRLQINRKLNFAQMSDTTLLHSLTIGMKLVQLDFFFL